MAEEGNGGSPPPKTFTEEQYKAAIADKEKELQTKLTSAQEKAAKWDEYESKGKSEVQKLAEKAAADSARAARAEQELAAYKTAQDNEKHRAKYGEKYNLERADWGRIPGSTEQEIEAAAKAWAKEKGRDRVGGPTPSGSGKNGEFTENDVMNAAFRAMARGGSIGR